MIWAFFWEGSGYFWDWFGYACGGTRRGPRLLGLGGLWGRESGYEDVWCAVREWCECGGF